MLFADFSAGQVLGTSTDAVTAQQLAEWAELYPWDQPAPGMVPTGLATILLMRSYHKAIPHRPPGNIHSRQQMEVHSPIRVGEQVASTVTCRSAELKRERRKLELDVTGKGQGERIVFSGLITLYWAA